MFTQQKLMMCTMCTYSNSKGTKAQPDINAYNIQEEIFQNDSMEVDDRDEDNWEVERHLLKQQIKELENALNKSKKLYQKFVEDVIQSEETRNQEFAREKRELIAINKRQNAEIRELTKEKCFYEATCMALMKEKEESSNPENSSQATEVKTPLLPLRCSTTRASKMITQHKRSGNDSKYKISTKLFNDNKKLKEKISQLTKSNANLRLQVKQLENYKNKIQKRKEEQVKDQQEMHDLLKSTTRTNSQTLNKLVLSQLDEMNRMQPKIELLFHK